MRISLEIERMSGGLLPSRVEVQESDAFHHVRQQIAAICGVPPEDQRLIFAGREITADNATVEELGLQTGSKIRMVVKGGTAVFVAPRSSGHARDSFEDLDPVKAVPRQPKRALAHDGSERLSALTQEVERTREMPIPGKPEVDSEQPNGRPKPRTIAEALAHGPKVRRSGTRPLYDNGLKLPIPMPHKYDEEGGARTPGQYEELVKQKMQEQEGSSLINSPASLSRTHSLSRGGDDGFKSANAQMAPVDWDVLLRSQVPSPSDSRLGPSQPLPLTRSGLASTGILSGMASPGNGPFSFTRQQSLSCFDWVDRSNGLGTGGHTPQLPMPPQEPISRGEDPSGDRTRRWPELQRQPAADTQVAHVGPVDPDTSRRAPVGAAAPPHPQNLQLSQYAPSVVSQSKSDHSDDGAYTDLTLSSEARRLLYSSTYELTKDEKIQRRMLKNRASAERSRKRKQDYVEELEMKLSCALSEKDILLSKIHKAMSHAKGMMLSKASTP